MGYGHFDVRRQEEWSAGRPQRTFWAGIKKPERTFKITTFRCIRRGYRMEFANPSEAGDA